ncbi:DUF2752 domain-containing protein [Rudanella paleaurantiibacter]|uniref:DUF2752 domain-containing protein n=1 Tax=Rudanella paleaurantiibacter TaxID=2614655 RepID=A0A7J5U0T3_9BACT|nr:DUF2752 domain-containing protein [Rudanella paleaurantiibacter]KAB7731255.1 DUF2752 domain-containing protein [Rudanella paleaurantiibacter]
MTRFGRYIELFVWVAGLLWLAFTEVESAHYSVCVFRAAGFEHCPGCGLGHGVSHLLHGRLAESWASHPLAIPALLILLNRMWQLVKFDSTNKHQIQ